MLDKDRKKKKVRVNRLYDTEADEVSLVDEPAIKRRFLVVKRRTNMFEVFDDGEGNAVTFGTLNGKSQGTDQLNKSEDADLKGLLSKISDLARSASENLGDSEGGDSDTVVKTLGSIDEIISSIKGMGKNEHGEEKPEEEKPEEDEVEKDGGDDDDKDPDGDSGDGDGASPAEEGESEGEGDAGDAKQLASSSPSLNKNSEESLIELLHGIKVSVDALSKKSEKHESLLKKYSSELDGIRKGAPESSAISVDGVADKDVDGCWEGGIFADWGSDVHSERIQKEGL